MNKKMIQEWPFQWWGFCTETPTKQSPSLDEITDPTWRPDDIEKVIQYLKNCPCLVTAGQGPGKCALCGEEYCSDNSAFLSDGKWFWPSGIEHYIEKHDMVLPDRMLEHIRKNKYRLPKNMPRLGIDTFTWPTQETESLDKFR